MQAIKRFSISINLNLQRHPKTEDIDELQHHPTKKNTHTPTIKHVHLFLPLNSRIWQTAQRNRQRHHHHHPENPINRPIISFPPLISFCLKGRLLGCDLLLEEDLTKLSNVNLVRTICRPVVSGDRIWDPRVFC